MSEIIDTTDKAGVVSEETTPTQATENMEGEEAGEAVDEEALAGEIDFSMMANINNEFVQALIESA